MVAFRLVETGRGTYVGVESRLPISLPYVAHEWDVQDQVNTIISRRNREEEQRRLTEVLSKLNAPILRLGMKD